MDRAKVPRLLGGIGLSEFAFLCASGGRLGGDPAAAVSGGLLGCDLAAVSGRLLGGNPAVRCGLSMIGGVRGRSRCLSTACTVRPK